MRMFSKKNCNLTYHPNEDNSLKNMLEWASRRLGIRLKKGKNSTYDWNGYDGFFYEDKEKKITWSSGILKYETVAEIITWKEGEGIIQHWRDGILL